MTQSKTGKSGPPPIVFILLFLGLLGAGYWFFFRKPLGSPVSVPNFSVPNSSVPNSSEAPAPSGQSANNSNPGTTAFSPQSAVPSGTTIRISGSTSMVQINQRLQDAFEQQFPGTKVQVNAGGTERGIQSLTNGQVELAAASRPLNQAEQNQGLVAVPIATDAIAIVVGNENAFRTGITSTQAIAIFEGQITNWSEVGGLSSPIRVINRPVVSGTHQAFKELVLKGGSFGNGPNFTTLDRDATTPLLQALKRDGIGYATYAQVATQRTIRTVAVDGLTPEAANYPFKRSLYYVYKNPPNEAVKAFLGYAMSSQGQQVLNTPQ